MSPAVILSPFETWGRHASQVDHANLHGIVISCQFMHDTLLHGLRTSASYLYDDAINNCHAVTTAVEIIAGCVTLLSRDAH